MQTFYYTYGLNPGYPFRDGWTEIEAPDIDTASVLFRAVHPDRPGDTGVLNCAGVYPEELFKSTRMYTDSNFGGKCHERISLKVDIFLEESKTTSAVLEGGSHADED